MFGIFPDEARYGMSIHWGAYSIAVLGEWARNRERIPQDEYVKEYVLNWKAEHDNPKEWVSLAQDAGMKYLVLTTRHHDGFYLWDSDTTSYNEAVMGPERDLLRPYVDAVREAGLGLSFTTISQIKLINQYFEIIDPHEMFIYHNDLMGL